MKNPTTVNSRWSVHYNFHKISTKITTISKKITTISTKCSTKNYYNLHNIYKAPTSKQPSSNCSPRTTVGPQIVSVPQIHGINIYFLLKFRKKIYNKLANK